MRPPGFWEIVVIVAVILLLFGGKRIPEMMRGLGEGIRSFKESLKGETKPAEAGKPEEKPKT
ncbi:MAG: twin-arginine translocase TatA/TatE family subunit [Terriglobia bacterium]